MHPAPPTNPIAAATHPNPYPYYQQLAVKRPFAFHDDLGMWVAASHSAVAGVLEDPACLVRPPAEPVPTAFIGTPIGRVFQELARMNEGARHQEARHMVFSILGGFEDQRLTRAVDEVWPLFRDLRSVLWRFPACVLARGMGFPVDELLSIAGCVEDFTLCIAPRADLASRFDSGNVAAEQLWNCFSGGASTPAEIANRIGILSQACEATAGLIGNSIAGFPATVDEVSRLDPAVQNTRRFTAAPSTTIQGVTVDAGSTVLVILARTFPNGAGRHECAAFGLATAIAGHGVSRISRNIRPIGYRPSPNTRIPEFEPQELKQ